MFRKVEKYGFLKIIIEGKKSTIRDPSADVKKITHERRRTITGMFTDGSPRTEGGGGGERPYHEYKSRYG